MISWLSWEASIFLNGEWVAEIEGRWREGTEREQGGETMVSI